MTSAIFWDFWLLPHPCHPFYQIALWSNVTFWHIPPSFLSGLRYLWTAPTCTWLDIFSDHRVDLNVSIAKFSTKSIHKRVQNINSHHPSTNCIFASHIETPFKNTTHINRYYNLRGWQCFSTRGAFKMYVFLNITNPESEHS